MAANDTRPKFTIRRGSTPTLRLHVHEDITDMNPYVSFESLCTLVTKSGEDVTLEPDDEEGWTKVTTTLTQQDTLSFKSGETCEVQVRAAKLNGEVAIATKCAYLLIGKVLDDAVIR